MRHFRKSSISSDDNYPGEHCFEHWYRDNSVYFLTAGVRGGVELELAIREASAARSWMEAVAYKRYEKA